MPENLAALEQTMRFVTNALATNWNAAAMHPLTDEERQQQQDWLAEARALVERMQKEGYDEESVSTLFSRMAGSDKTAAEETREDKQ